MNFADINLDLQGVARRTYENLLYKSSGAMFLNEEFIGDLRNTGVPIIEVIKQLPTTITVRNTEEIETALTPELVSYDSVIVKLTDLKMDYSFKISPNINTTNISGTIDGQMDLRDSEIAITTDSYIYDKMATAITGNANGSEAYTLGQVIEWGGTDFDYVTALNTLKAYLFNRKVYDKYRLGLEAVEYAKFVSTLTTLLKFETMAGVDGVDMGDIAYIYGVTVFQVNTEVLPTGVLGFFAHPIGLAGDYYFNNWAQYPGNYQGFPGYWVLEGSISFGCEVVRTEAIIKLVAPTP